MKKPLGTGGFLIVLSFWIAVASLFFSWVEISHTSRSVSSWTITAVEIAIVLLLWSYPLQIAGSQKRMGVKATIALGALAIAVPVAVGYAIDQGALFDAGPGILILSVGGFLLMVGLILHLLHHLLGRNAQPVVDADCQNLRCGRCCWISNDDLHRYVRVHVPHAKGFAQFALEPGLMLVENHGLHPWALGEAQELLKRHQGQIRTIWDGRRKTVSAVEPMAGEGALYQAGKTVGGIFVGLFGRFMRR
jgi:hypothetical protein